jgi:glycine C-acetyltransferase
MSLAKLNASLLADIDKIKEEGRAKAPERVLSGWLPPSGDRGPRFRLQGTSGEFVKMNSNSYLSLSHHPDVIAAADEAAREFGAGPGSVRFIDGTTTTHVALEARIAAFVGRPAARIFNSAYTSTLGLAITLAGPDTYWIGDELNHNCIIRAMRIANVPSAQRAIFKHNDAADLARHLDNVPAGMNRVIVIFDGIFSMRGDHAPLDVFATLAREYDGRFRDGVITVMDDSHGIGAYGATGRGRLTPISIPTRSVPLTQRPPYGRSRSPTARKVECGSPTWRRARPSSVTVSIASASNRSPAVIPSSRCSPATRRASARWSRHSSSAASWPSA